MSYIIKHTAALINTMVTDAARKKMSQGDFNISYFQVGDSEVCYDCVSTIDNVDYNILMPQYNSQNLAPIPQKNKMQVKYPLFLDSTSGSTFGVPLDSSYIDSIYNSAAPRGFFSGTTNSFSLNTTSAYTITSNWRVTAANVNSGDTITLEYDNIDPFIFTGNVTPGMFVTLFTNNSITPLSGNSSIFTYVVVGVTGYTSGITGSVTIRVDRDLPTLTTFSGPFRTVFYPSGMTQLYDSYTPSPFWSDDVINFETNCDLSQSDVKIWNMNVPWSESPAGVFSNTYQNHELYSSVGYLGSKEYLGYNSDSGQIDSDSTYYYNSFSEKVSVLPSEQKAIAIVHYTNQSVDNFYGEKFATRDYDATSPGGTGQARNFKLSIPWLLWHKNINGTIGQDFYVDPSGFTSQNLFTVNYIKSKKDINFNDPGLRYYHLWDTNANDNGYPNRVGKVFPDLKIVTFDDDEIIAALSYKSNRSFTLPAPKLGLVTPNTFSGVLGSTVGLLSGETETLFLTYILYDTAINSSMHCNYYSKISGNNQSLLSGTSDVIIRFGNEFPFLTGTVAGSVNGFTADKIKLIVQRVTTTTTATTKPIVTAWKEIDITSQFTLVSGKLTSAGMSGTTIQLTNDMYTNSATTYDLNNYVKLPTIGQTGVTLNFGGEYYFYGTIKTDITATIYVMNYLCNLGQTQFFDSSNPTWKGKNPYISEVALYNADKELMVVSKIQSPEKRQGVQQYPIKIDF